jgi:hypothetical protein
VTTTEQQHDPEDRDDIYGNGETLQEVVSRFSRRRVLGGAAAAAVAAAVNPFTGLGRAAAEPVGQGLGPGPAGPDSGSLGFEPVPPSTADGLFLSPGHVGNVLIAWGDPIFAGVPSKDPRTLTPGDQEQRFGYNNDYVAYIPLPYQDAERHGLLWVNHEYTDAQNMFPGYDPDAPSLTFEQVLVELHAHGGSIVEIERVGPGWRPVLGGRYNRRITANTPMEITGPAAGHPWLQTNDDPTGRRVFGTLNNCAGGLTPWGTVLTCEENFNGYFGNLSAVEDPVLAASYRRYGLSDTGAGYQWPWHVHRFNMGLEPNEPNRHGWVVEIDPLDPRSTPKKRTALGRFKHEGAAVAISRAGKACVYSGDDERFDYAYKFISDRSFDPGNRATGRDILESGTLHVAKFNDDGSGEWIPVVHSDPRLSGAFGSQAEVLIRTREAADLLGATKMDRPEDFQRDAATGRVYLALTNNTNRGKEGSPGPDAANPRAANAYGHIIEITELFADPGELRFTWEIFMLCGPEGDPSRKFGSVDPATVGDIANPDNLTFDSYGNLWISTDGQPGSLEQNDTLQACPTTGPDRGRVKRFLTAPKGAEVTGPCFTPANTTLFVAIQHPGENGTLAEPESRWPDYVNGFPRPALWWVTKPEGNPRVGS